MHPILYPRVEGAFFDLDGTLAFTEELLFEVMKERLALRECDVSSFPFESAVGIPDVQAAARIVRHYGLAERPESFRAEYQAVFRKRISTVLKERPGAETLLRQFDGTGIPRGLVTSAPLTYADAVLDALGFRSFFKTVVTADTVGLAALKPDPAPYLLAAEQLSAKPFRCIVFEDSYVGTRSARAAGMIVVGLPHRLAPRENLKGIAHYILPEGQTLADFRLEHVDELLPQRRF